MKSLKDRVLYTSLKNQRKIEKICQPLIDHFDLSYFYYFKVTNEGDYGFFGNKLNCHSKAELIQKCLDLSF